jgi:hypothetical protein
MRILGNIIADSQDYLPHLIQNNLLDHIHQALLSTTADIRRDACWLASNITCDRPSASAIIRNETLTHKLVELFFFENVLPIKKELTYIFTYLAHNGEKKATFTLLCHENLL